MENAGGGGTTIHVSTVDLSFSGGNAQTSLRISSCYLIAVVPDTTPIARNYSYYMIPSTFYESQYWHVWGEISGSAIGSSSAKEVPAILFYIDK